MNAEVMHGQAICLDSGLLNFCPNEQDVAFVMSHALAQSFAKHREEYFNNKGFFGVIHSRSGVYRTYSHIIDHQAR